MEITKQLAGRIREILLSGTWVAATNYKIALSDLTWEDAGKKVGTLNTIAALTFHVNYYIAGVLAVLEGGPLTIQDRYSFDLPPVRSPEDWKNLLNKFWEDAEKFAVRVEQMPEETLPETFVEEKYGTYQRNIEAMIEHSYYHLGQIVLIKKMLLLSKGNVKES